MRRLITFFVSYAYADKRLPDTFVQYLNEQRLPSKHYAYTLWRDTAILVGQNRHAEIQQALHACQAGLLLLSPAFLASTYIRQDELPRFLQPAGPPILPLLLKAIDMQRHDMQGLAPYQMFSRNVQQAFAACTTDLARSRFAASLFAQIEEHLDRLGLRP